jgi:predicted Fe-Mo cluster-binding NifX family protein
MAEKICKLGHRFEKTSDCPTCPTCAKEEIKSAYANGFPKIGSPAFNALKHKGITLSDLPKYSEMDLLAIHGVGPKAVGILRQYLAGKGLGFVKK